MRPTMAIAIDAPPGSDAPWGFLLRELPGKRTRLITTGYWTMQPRWLQPLVSVALYE